MNYRIPRAWPPHGGKCNQLFLNAQAEKVYADLMARNLPRLQAKLIHKWTYTDLPCPSISTENPEINVIFMDHNDVTDTLFLFFRKTNGLTISYQGFWPFGTDINNVPLTSFYAGMYLTWEWDRQYRNEWSMQAIVKAYPELNLNECDFCRNVQRFGFEVLGYGPREFQPPYNLFMAT